MGQRFSKIEASLLAPSMEGNLDEVKLLVGKFIAECKNENDCYALKHFVDRKDPAGNTAIHGAVFSGHLEVVSFLAESCRADLKIKNGLGCTPLWIAAGYNRMDCLEYLIRKISQMVEDNKCDVFAQYLLDANDSGDSPFLAAASRGNADVCRCLLGSIDTFFEGKHEWKDDAKRKLLRTANKAGDTPLKVAVAAGHDIELLTFLLESDLSLRDSDGPLQDDELCINRKNKLGLTPLIIACERNLSFVVELLMKFGADTHVRDSKGRNILAIASFCGCDDVVRLLISRMKQSTSESVILLLDERDYLGCTPLWLAARTGKLSVVELLVDAGADETIADDKGLSPAEVASIFKKEKVDEYFKRRSRS
eukprot:CCRYP_019336-RA/>CCRYP_019336-RA protein AED:0.05 eAED:0.05 QI:246/1/1/1/1/1/2/677/365